MTSETTYLYRHFSKDGKLLYVGIAKNEMARRKQHMKKSPWFCIVHRIEVEEHPSRFDAELYENAAIRKENPIYNVMGSSNIGMAMKMRSEIKNTQYFAKHEIYLKSRVAGEAGIAALLYRKYLDRFGAENREINERCELRSTDVARGVFWLSISYFSGYSWWWRREVRLASSFVCWARFFFKKKRNVECENINKQLMTDDEYEDAVKELSPYLDELEQNVNEYLDGLRKAV